MVCESCANASPEGSKFCIHCGAALVAAPAPAPPPPPPPFVPETAPDSQSIPEPDPQPGSEPVTPDVTSRQHPPPVLAPPPPPPVEATPPPPPPVAPLLTPPPPISTVAPAAPSGSAPPSGMAPPAAAPPPLAPEELAPAEPESPIAVVDPAELGPAVARLSANAQRAGRVAAAVLSALLHEGEHVDALVQGRYQNNAGVAVLTSERIMLVNDHEWRPDIREIAITADLVVQGWQDDRTASLTFVAEGRSMTIEMITDRPLAQEMAHMIRSRVADLAG